MPRKMQSRALLVLVGASSLGCLASASSGAVFSDDFSANTLASYTLAGGSSVTYSASAGVGGGGGLVIGQGANDSTSIIPGNPTQTSFLVSPGAGGAVTMSMMLKLNSGGFGGGTSKAFLGLADGVNHQWGQNSPAGTSVVGGALQNAVQIGFRGGANGGSSANGGMQPAVSLTGGNWYLYSTTLQKPTSGTTWIASGFLQDYGATGTTPGAVVATLPPSNVNLTGDLTLSLAATPTFMNFGVRNQSWSAVDNFSVTVVPEPTSLAAAVAALGLCAVRRSRRTI